MLSLPPRWNETNVFRQFPFAHTAFTLHLQAQLPNLLVFEANLCIYLHLRPGDSLITPRVTLSIGFRALVSLISANQATGLLAFTPAGLPPAEHTSLFWTHKCKQKSIDAYRVNVNETV